MAGVARLLACMALVSVRALQLPALRRARPTLNFLSGPKRPRTQLQGISPFDDAAECSIIEPLACGSEEECATDPCGRELAWLTGLAELQERGFGTVALLAATALSLTLANWGLTGAAWRGFWAAPLGPRVAGHALSARGWVNEGLMAVFFFLVGLEIKQELRVGALRSVRKAALPCIAAVGGMMAPMAVYAAAQRLVPAAGRSLAGLAVPMATDIAFAMAVFGAFRDRMPASASAFLLTLATVDDLGAIAVLATCFAKEVLMGPLLGCAAVVAGLAAAGRRKCQDVRVFGAGLVASWWCLLKAGVSADVAGVLCALCVSTQAGEGGCPFVERLIRMLSPLASFVIMPLFALANTAVAVRAVRGAPGVGPAVGIGLGLLLGKPLGIFGSAWLATRLGAELPGGMRKRHLGVVSVLGAIGFTMCLLLAEVALPAAGIMLPTLAVLGASGVAATLAAVLMFRMEPFCAPKEELVLP